jgi:23S rRNA pseudouridine1911/1915/1917 synthase
MPIYGDSDFAMALVTVPITVEESQAGRVDVVVQKATGVSRGQVRGLVDNGCISINGKRCTAIAAQVTTGDVVSVRYDPNQRYHEKKKHWDDRTFHVIFEDDYLIVVDKSAGVLTVPTDWNEKNTLVDRVSLYLSHSRRKRMACVVHRLDREVSGLLVFGKTESIAEALIDQFKQRKPERLYLAIVAGVIEADAGTFDGHLATGKNLDRFVTRPSKNTEAAITHFRVLRRMSDTTLVEAQLETGKRNQIRVHFADAGHPVLGDPRYKIKEAKHPRWIRQRIALHAQTLAFEHPVTHEQVKFESPVPAAIEKFLAGSRD